MFKKEKPIIQTYGKRKDLRPLKKYFVFVLFIALLVIILLLYTKLSITARVIDSIYSIEEVKQTNNPEQAEINNNFNQLSQKKEVSPTNIKEGLSSQQEKNIISLSSSQFAKDLPYSGIISLKVSGTYFTVKRNLVKKEKATNPDLLISLPGKYFDSPSSDLCDISRKAATSKDLQIEAYASKPVLAWKYSSMYKYKSCLGL